MAGSGSYDPIRSSSYSAGQSGSSGSDCLQLSFVATLQLPSEPVDDLQVGDVLEVARFELADGSPIVGVFDAKGRTVGSIVDELGALLPCIAAGAAFIAEVSLIRRDVPIVQVSAAVRRRVVGEATVEVVSGHVPTVGFQGALSLTSPGSIESLHGLPMAVVTEVGADVLATIEHPRQCELRALLRAGVPFRSSARTITTVVLTTGIE